MKKYTKEEIAQQLMDNQSLEFAINGTPYYNIHISEDGELLPWMNGAAESFSADARYATELEVDDIYNMESLDCTEFMEVAEKLAEQVNAWLDEQES